MLFLKITPDYNNIAPHIKANASTYGIDTYIYEYTDRNAFQQFLQDHRHEPYDYLYIGSHGNESGIAKTHNGESHIRWADLAMDICANPGLTEQSVVYLGCCKGGLKRGALIMMSHCDTIHHVVGSECNVNEQDVNLAFATFASHHCKGTEAKRIESIVSMTIDKGFSMYSRYNMDVEIASVREYLFPDLPDVHLPHDFYILAEEEESTQIPASSGSVIAYDKHEEIEVSSDAA